MSEHTENDGINLLDGIPSQPDFVDSMDPPNNNYLQGSFLSYPSSPQKQAYSTSTISNNNSSNPYQLSSYQQQLEQMNKQHQSQKIKTLPLDNYSDAPVTQIQSNSYQQSYLPQYQNSGSSYSQQPQATQSSYSQPQQSTSSYSQHPVQNSYPQSQSTQSGYSQGHSSSSYAQQPSQSSQSSYSQPSQSSYSQTGQSSYSQQPQSSYAPSSSSTYPTQYTSSQIQQTLSNSLPPSQSKAYSGNSTHSTSYQSSQYQPLQPAPTSYSTQSGYSTQSSYSEPAPLSTSTQQPRAIAPYGGQQGYSTSSNSAYYSTPGNSSSYSTGSGNQGYPPSSSAYSSYGNQYPSSTSQSGSVPYVTTSQSIVSKQEGMKVNINPMSRPLAPSRGKGGLLQRVFDDNSSPSAARYVASDPVANDAYWISQGMGAPVIPYSSSSYGAPALYQNTSRSFSTPTTNRARPTTNDNNRRSSGSSSRRADRNRYSARDSYAADSEDDDFIDNRDFNELSENSRSQDDTLSDDGEMRESSITTRKRRRENNLDLFENDSDNSNPIIESDFGDEKLRPVTRSRVGSERKQKRHDMHYHSDDSDMGEEDDESVKESEDDDVHSISEEKSDDEGSGAEAKNGENDQEGEGEGGKKKISQLQKLITVCEQKVEKLTEILAQNGLEYEKLKQTAVSITLPLAISQPTLLSDHCKLTQYQLVGLNWLWLLYQANLNGILADEMGLGKTLQTIAMFALLKEKNIAQGPHLVVVPSSTLTQWYNEIQHWCPTLKTVTYYGNIAERKEIRAQCKNHEDFDILLTTYQLVGGKSDKKLFKNIPWHYLVLDEAQNIKNGSSLRFQTLFKIKATNKLLLTGTPLQNNLQELWALLHFLMSDEFERLKIENYSEVFRDFIKTNNSEGPKRKKRLKVTEQDEYISKLKKILEPFLLRRLKKEVSLDLSEKIHNKEVVTMTDTQQSLYTQIYMHSKSVWNEKQHQKQMMRGVVKDGNKSISLHNFLNNLLMQLRKVSNHPLLLRVYYDDSMIRQIAQILTTHDSTYKKDRIEDIVAELSMSSDWELHEICSSRKETITQLAPFLLSDEQVFGVSGKMNKLKEILDNLKKENRRVLIFSQMTKMMNILACLFDHEGHSYVRLDGSTPVADRQVLIDQYNEDPNLFIFLLSTRAGGLGINLSTADTVIFYDIAFNPQVDRQAEDRCHRLGQTKQVNIITLLTKDTCEEQIWEMAHEKKELNDIMLQEGEYSKKFQDEGDYEIIEEKEEELGTDAAMQVVLTQIFSPGEPIQLGDNLGEEKEKEKKTKKASPAKEKKEKIEKPKKEKVVKEKKEKIVKEKVVKEKKPPKEPKEPKPKKEKVPKSPASEKKEKTPKTPKVTKTPPKTPTRKSGRMSAKNTPIKYADGESTEETPAFEGNLKRSESHLFETIADQPKRKRKLSTPSSLLDSSPTTNNKAPRKSRASTPSAAGRKKKKVEEEFEEFELSEEEKEDSRDYDRDDEKDDQKM